MANKPVGRTLRSLGFTALLATGAALAGPASAPDTIAQRMLACTACHGKEGRASSEGYYPRLAGKPAGYLYNQLLNFRDGRRRGGRMAGLVEHLNDAYLHEMAAYFAGLDLPYPAAPPPLGDAATLARGEQLVRRGDAARELPACQACHGETLMGMQPATPGLLALPRDYLISQIGRWQVGVRRAQAPDCMAQVAQRLRPEDLAAVASWLAAQPVPTGAKPAAAPAGPLPLRCGPEAAR
ncbi:c-type cytochrome [Aquabacterium sp.]|uniref:c-type cytochrome n=1 Tax=Aquabacterium sp. TaxID=1872578 RepID=UPI003782FE76